MDNKNIDVTKKFVVTKGKYVNEEFDTLEEARRFAATKKNAQITYYLKKTVDN